MDTADLFIVLKEGKAGGPYITLDSANKDGAVTPSYGLFLNSVISFIIVSWFAFFLVKAVNQVTKKEERYLSRQTKDCPMCYSEINKKVTVCAFCASQLENK